MAGAKSNLASLYKVVHVSSSKTVKENPSTEAWGAHDPKWGNISADIAQKAVPAKELLSMVDKAIQKIHDMFKDSGLGGGGAS